MGDLRVRWASAVQYVRDLTRWQQVTVAAALTVALVTGVSVAWALDTAPVVAPATATSSVAEPTTKQTSVLAAVPSTAPQKSVTTPVDELKDVPEASKTPVAQPAPPAPVAAPVPATAPAPASPAPIGIPEPVAEPTPTCTDNCYNGLPVDRTPRVTTNANYQPGCDGVFHYSQETTSGGGMIISLDQPYTWDSYSTVDGYGIKVSICVDW